MRAFLVILSLLSLLFCNSIFAADSLELAKRFNQAGAPQLALLHVERDQPGRENPAAWLEWESLRLTLLSELKRPQELIKRVQQLPPGVPPEMLQQAYGYAAWACLETGQGNCALDYLARLLWQFKLTPQDHMKARRMVIQSYLMQHKADDAYLAMLRFQQDFQPLDKEQAAWFAESLLAENHPGEAMTWLPLLESASPVALQIRLSNGLMSAESAMAAARSALQKNGSADYWEVVAAAAGMQKDGALQLAAREQLLNARGDQLSGAAAQTLWKEYLLLAEAAGNQAQLLQGDDMAWLELAQQRMQTAPSMARALYAYLVQRGAVPQIRRNAQVQLVSSLLRSGLDQVVVRLFQEGAMIAGNDAQALNNLLPQMEAGMRQNLLIALGGSAESRGNHALAADYYLQAALAGDGQTLDPLALKARIAAAENLERAGFQTDAKALYRTVQLMKTLPKPASHAGRKKKR